MGIVDERKKSDDEDRSAIRAVHRRMSDIDRRLAEHAVADREAFERLDQKLEGHSSLLGNVRENTAAMAAELRGMTADIAHHRELERVQAAAEAQTEIETVKANREAIPWRYKLWIAIVGAVGAIIGAIASILAK